MSDDTAAQAEEIRQSAASQYQRLRDNTDLSNSGLRQRLAQVYVDTQNKLDALRPPTVDNTAAKALLQARLFGITNPKDPASVVSYRDARREAADLDPRDEAGASAALGSAITAGDDVLARAIFARSFDVGWSDVANEYLVLHPELDTDAQTLWDMQRPSVAAGLWSVINYRATPPAELSGERDIEAVATGSTVQV